MRRAPQPSPKQDGSGAPPAGDAATTAEPGSGGTSGRPPHSGRAAVAAVLSRLPLPIAGPVVPGEQRTSQPHPQPLPAGGTTSTDAAAPRAPTAGWLPRLKCTACRNPQYALTKHGNW